MFQNRLFGIGLIITLIISVEFIGCNNDDGTDTSSTGGTTGGGSGGGTAGTKEPGGPYTFTGWVEDAVDHSRLEGLKVVALSNDDGITPLGPEATTAADGTFTLGNLEPEMMCIEILGTEGVDDPRIDSFTCNIETNEQDRFVVSTTSAIAEMIVTGMIGKSDPNKASAAGAVYYWGEDGKEYPVNCATVRVVGAPDAKVFYFVDTLPNKERVETDAAGRFLAMELDPGTVELEALVNGEVIGSISLPVQAPINLTGGQYSSNNTRIYADAPGDPTPDCTE